MLFERKIPFFDRCDVAGAILALTRDETLVHALAIALRVKFDPRSCDMRELGDGKELERVIRDRVTVLGCAELETLARIFCRRNIGPREYDRNDSLRSGA